MTTYFKATRPNGTDFHTGTVDYAAALGSGETLTHPRQSVKGIPSTYFSVATVPTDCTGFSFPCRLFTVEPVGRALKADPSLPNKRRVSALRVVEELPADHVFGPHAEDVIRVIRQAERLPQFTESNAAARAAAWAAPRDAVWDAAWAAARDAARDAAWAAAWDAAWDATWAAAWAAAWDAAWAAPRDAAWDAAWAAAWAAARAAVGELARDLITAKQHAALVAPWQVWVDAFHLDGAA